MSGALAPCITATTFPVNPVAMEEEENVVSKFLMGFTQVFLLFFANIFELSDLKLQIAKQVASGSCKVLIKQFLLT